MTVIADTGPVNYLILSGYIDLIQRLYGSLILPAAVHRELLHPKAPALVRQWTMTLPAWVDFRVPLDSSQFAELGPGEREAISLALETKAEILLRPRDAAWLSFTVSPLEVFLPFWRRHPLSD
jgi:predicted nucleic acid-binding protein